MKKIYSIVLLGALLMLAGCQTTENKETPTSTPTTTVEQTEDTTPTPPPVDTTPTPETAATDAPAPTSTPVSTETPTPVPEGEEWKLNCGIIDLEHMTVIGNGVTIQGNKITITEGGDFIVTGKNADAHFVISVPTRVKLRLSGASLTSAVEPVIYVEAADKVFITMEDGTSNELIASGSEEAAIYSKDDLEIKGKGTLNVIAKKGHGIKASDDLNIENGTLVIEAARDGIHVNETCDISGGSITVTAVGDGIDCEEDIVISGGTFQIKTTGNNSDVSSKGIVAETCLTVYDGSFSFDTTGKEVKCNGDIIVHGGNLDL